ncbi:unnamed protein product, partial [Effrenium voratum]
EPSMQPDAREAGSEFLRSSASQHLTQPEGPTPEDLRAEIKQVVLAGLKRLDVGEDKWNFSAKAMFGTPWSGVWILIVVPFCRERTLASG